MFEIGEKIKKMRELKNYKQDYMAQHLNITQAGYSKIESGQTDISFSKLNEISKILEVSVEDLISFDSQKFFNSFNNVKGNNNGNVFINMSNEDIRTLYESKINLLEKLLLRTENDLESYRKKFDNN